MRRTVQGVLAMFGGRLVRWPPPATYFAEAGPEDKEIVERCLPFTMVSRDVLWSTVAAARYVERLNIPGDIAECGVWRGGNTMAAALATAGRHLWLYDTFAGMPQPTALDRTTGGPPAMEKWRDRNRGAITDWCYASIGEVVRNLNSTGCDPNRLHFIEGRIEDTLNHSHNLPDQISVLRLDTDWYESTRRALDVLYPRLVSRGVLILDDYGRWEGARKAVDEYLGGSLLLTPVSRAVRIAIKP